MNSIPIRVVILTRATGTPAVRRLVEALERRGARAAVLKPGEAPTSLACDAPGCVLSRLPSGTPAWETQTLALAAAELDAPWLNPPEALATTHDKARALARLASHGIPVPPTVCVQRDGKAQLDGLPGERFVVKPPTGLAGRGVVVGLDRASAAARAAAYAELCGRALVQPWLGEGLDRRVVVVGGRPVTAMQRVPSGAGRRGNTAYGARAEAWEPGDAELSLALAAAAVLGLDVAAVDLLRHEGRALVLEVNACPGLTAVERASGRNVAGAIARLCIERADKHALAGAV